MRRRWRSRSRSRFGDGVASLLGRIASSYEGRSRYGGSPGRSSVGLGGVSLRRRLPWSAGLRVGRMDQLCTSDRARRSDLAWTDAGYRGVDVGAGGSGAGWSRSLSASELELSSLSGCLGRWLDGWVADAWFEALVVLPLASAETPRAESMDCWESYRASLARRPAELTSTCGCVTLPVVVVVLSTSGTSVGDTGGAAPSALPSASVGVSLLA